MSRDRHYCPACGDSLVSEPIEAPLRCKHCGWHLITREAWKALPPFRQGFSLYAQGSWPTSELARATNPYEEGTPSWQKFREGEHRAMLAALDSEE
jgi:hypothetical protein